MKRGANHAVPRWALLALLCSSNFAVCRADDALKARLLAEGPKAWSQWEEFTSRLEGSFTETWEIIRDKNPEMVGVRSRKHRTFRTGGNAAVTISRDLFWLDPRTKKPDTVLLERVKGFNPRYVFHLKRNSEADPYILEALASPEEALESLEVFLPSQSYRYYFSEELNNPVFTPWIAADAQAKYRWQERGFSIKKVEEESENDTTLVRMDYEYRPPKGAAKRLLGGRIPRDDETLAIPNGRMWFDPNKRWAEVRSEEEVYYGTQTFVVEYGDTTRGFPLPRRIIRNITNESHESRHTWEVNSIGYRSAPETVFTLSAFGLPEPGAPIGVPPSASFFWLWVLILALLLGLAGAGWAFYLRKKATAATIA